MTTIHVSIRMEYMSGAILMGLLYVVCSRKKETEETKQLHFYAHILVKIYFY